MGEYATDHLDDMMDAWIDDGCPRIERWGRRKEPRLIKYDIYQVARETEKGILIQFMSSPVNIEKNKPTSWCYAFWFPKNYITILDNGKSVVIPEWLIDAKFEEGGIKIFNKQQEQE